MISSRAIAWATALAVVAVTVSNQLTMSTFGDTMSWKPGKLLECNSVDEVIAIVNESKVNGDRVKAYGTGWSWNTAIARDGDTYVSLRGKLADSSTGVQIDTTDHTAIVNGGVIVFELYMLLQKAQLDLEAHGACLGADESQTIGGLLATNVHHAGVKTFYDVAEWVDVVTATEGLVRTFQNEPLFQLTIGGKGRTGIIVRAKFNLAPRATYKTVESAQPVNGSLAAFFESYVLLYEGYDRNELIAMGIKHGYKSGQHCALVKTPEIMTDVAILPDDYGMFSKLIGYPVLFADTILDRILPPYFYPLSIGLVHTFTLGSQPDPDKEYKDLDVACSGAGVSTRLKHMEIEFFVPVNLMGAVGAFLDERFAEGAFPYIQMSAAWALRYTYGVNSLTAPSGIMYDGVTVTDTVAVNIDSFQRSKWDQYIEELHGMLAELSAQFPRQIRLHPGKYNPPMSPDPESTVVKKLLSEYDPQGIFSREEYNGAYTAKGWFNIWSIFSRGEYNGAYTAEGWFNIWSIFS